MAELVETIEDLQLRAFKPVQIFKGAEFQQQQTFANKNRWLAVSSRYGICVALGPRRQLYSMLAGDVHKLGENTATSSVKIRTIPYHNPQSELVAVCTNCNGTALAVVVQTPNGPFVDIFDILCFDPNSERQPFPLASIRLSSNSTAQLRDLEWNPAEADFFAAITTDNTISTVRCMALQQNAGAAPSPSSNTGGASFATLTLPGGALCLSWSPKGKQLVVGDADGRVHQLKPELSGPAVRQIEPPQDVPTYERQPLACTAICWLSTTEWLVAHQPREQQQPPNLSLLVVKKQQAPKWTHFGDVLPTARLGRLTFVPLLDWHMVFLYSPDCTQVALFGQHGEHWRKFEFETYDIEMPLASDGRTNTFPIGATLDFSSTTPLLLEQGAEHVQVAPPPMLHLLNSSGHLLPYAVVSLAKEARQALNKPSEPVQQAKARFGQPPPGWVPPPPPAPVLAQTPPTQQQSSNQFQTPPTMPPTAAPSQSVFQTPPTTLATTTAFGPPTSGGPDGQPVVRQQPQQPAALSVDQARVVEEERKKEAERQKKMAEEHKRRQQMAAQIEMERAVAGLELALEHTIVEYTQVRNGQAAIVELQLRRLRYEIEGRATATDLAHFDKLADIRNELLDGLRQKSRLLDGLCKNIRGSAETLNQLKLGHDQWKKQQKMDGGGEGKMMERRKAVAPSFDIQKRLELLQKHYDMTMNNFERAKRELAQLDEETTMMMRAGGIEDFNIVDRSESIDPVEQRKIMQTNENIGKMCAKLAGRLQQIQRQMEESATGDDGGKQCQQGGIGRRQIVPRGCERSGGGRVADFCVLELSQLSIDDGGGGPSSTTTGAEYQQQLLSSQNVDEQAEFKRNLYNYLASMEQFKSTEPTKIRRIQPLRPSATAQPQGTPLSMIPTVAAADDDQALAQKMRDTFSTPPRPQRVSIGVQSPDFMAMAPVEKAKPKKPPVGQSATPVMVTKQPPPPMFARASGLPFPLTTSTPAAPTPPLFSPATTAAGIAATAAPQTSSFSFKPQQPFFDASKNAVPFSVAASLGPMAAASSGVELPNLIGLTSGGEQRQTAPATAPTAIPTTSAYAALTAPAQTLLAATTTAAAHITTAAEMSAKAPLPTAVPPKVDDAEKQLPTAAGAVPTIPSIGKGGDETTAATVVTNAVMAPAPPSAETAAAPPPSAPADEGMEDETAAAADNTASTVNFNFAKGISLGGCAATSTPINPAAANRNPFGSITPLGAQNSSASSGGGGLFATPPSQFGTPTNRPSGGSAFGSFGTSAAASPVSASSSGAFGASPFATNGGGASAFGAKPAFGGGQSPFAMAAAQKSAFGASPFGGGMAQTTGTTSSGGGGSLFGGGTGAGGGGFSAFASKSSAFGQLANQAQQSGGGSSSLFGGGGTTAPGGTSSFTGFGTSMGGAGQSSPSSPFGQQQQKSSAFTTFRK